MSESLNSYSFWLFLGALPILISLLYQPEKILRQDELKKISTRFHDIDKTYNMAVLLYFGFLLILVSIWIIGLNDWSKLKFGVPFYPVITIAVSGYEIFHAIFATQRDVYPLYQGRSYSYSDKDIIHKKARYLIYLCIAVIVFSISIFFIVF